MIKGIDSQVITGRTTDYMKDSSARIKGEEFQQAMQSKIQENSIQQEMKTITNVKKRDIRKTDDEDDGQKKKKKPGYNMDDKKKSDVIIKTRKVNNASNAVSGNENVGYIRPSGLDIEI